MYIKIPISSNIIELLPKKLHDKSSKVAKYVDIVLVPSYYIKQNTTKMKQK
jgi:hypothetical protein